MQSGKIMVIGSSNTDMTVVTQRHPEPGETVLGGNFRMGAGGKGANQAVAAKRLGGNVSFVCKVGSDLFGDNSIQHYRDEGLDISGIMKSDAASGVALITVDAAGENAIAEAVDNTERTHSSKDSSLHLVIHSLQCLLKRKAS